MTKDLKASRGVLVRVLAVIAALALGGMAELSAQKRLGDLAEPFELKNVRTGETVRLDDFKGSIVVLDFFSYW